MGRCGAGATDRDRHRDGREAIRERAERSDRHHPPSGGSAIQDKGIGDLHGLSNLTPNVNLDGGAPFSGDNSVLSASIRGIGQDDFAFNIDPGVGVYVDGVYLARTIGANVDCSTSSASKF